MLQPLVLTSSSAGVPGQRSKASSVPSQSESPARQAPNAGAASARTMAPAMARHQAERLFKRIIGGFLSAEAITVQASLRSMVPRFMVPGFKARRVPAEACRRSGPVARRCDIGGTLCVFRVRSLRERRRGARPEVRVDVLRGCLPLALLHAKPRAAADDA